MKDFFFLCTSYFFLVFNSLYFFYGFRVSSETDWSTPLEIFGPNFRCAVFIIFMLYFISIFIFIFYFFLIFIIIFIIISVLFFSSFSNIPYFSFLFSFIYCLCIFLSFIELVQLVPSMSAWVGEVRTFLLTSLLGLKEFCIENYFF